MTEFDEVNAPAIIGIHHPQSDDDDDDVNVQHRRQHHQQMTSQVLASLPKPRDDEEEHNSNSNDRYYSSTSTALTMYSPVNMGLDELYDSTNDYTTSGDFDNNSASVYPKNYSSYTIGRSNPFTGLSNQGATCYMNSLLQTMYMTPEFRKGLYQWNFLQSPTTTTSNVDDDEEEETVDEEDNIPFQLQKLFANLQLTTQNAISTKALTKSFGWTGADVFQQHDVQELARVLFDALEKSLKGTVNETLVNDLYQGMLKDYVKCLHCGYESSRNDNFLDLSLVIRPFGSDQMMRSVEEAMELFLRPEVLNKENQWMCDQCKVKRDAIKGLKFSQLPYLLSLQLKRFDFDYATMNRIKLHNEVKFPKYLNMNAYVGGDEASGNGRGKIARKMSMERHELEGKQQQQQHADHPMSPPMSQVSERMRRLSSMDETQPAMFDPNDNVLDGSEDPSEMDTWNPTFDPELMIKRSGPLVYELYSVLIHSGSALGGHYYAYIKALDTGKWYNFNDSNVSEISENEVKTAWGGSTGSAYMRYSTCAYMLMYRLVDPEKNVNSIPKESVPDYLQEQIRADEERIRRITEERIEMAKKVQLKFFMKGAKPKNVEKAVHVYGTATIAEALQTGRAAFANEKDVILPSIENCRLRGYNEYKCLLTDTYDGREQMTLSALGVYTGHQFFIEVKNDEEEWEDYDPTKLQLFIRRFVEPSDEVEDDRTTEVKNASDPQQMAYQMARSIQTDEHATIGSLCQLIAQKFSVPSTQKIRLIKKNATAYSVSPVKVLNHNEEEYTMNLRLKADLNLINGTEIFFEETPDLLLPSPAEAFFEREANMITVNFKYLMHPVEPIRIDRRETIRTLKQLISRKIGVPPEKFKILRGVSCAGVEIKAIDSTLYKVCIGSDQKVFIQDGVPLNVGEYNFRLMLYQPSRSSSSPPNSTVSATSSSLSDHDSGLTIVNGSTDDANGQSLFDLDELMVTTGKEESELTFVSYIIMSEEMMVEDIRQRVWEALQSKNLLPEGISNLTPSHIRLRDLRQNTMTSLLVDGRKLHEASKLAVYEGRSIVAEILTEPEHADPLHRIVDFAYVDRSTWRFDKHRHKEVVISQAQEQSNPGTYLAEVASAALDIPVERVRFARIPYHRDSIDILEVISYTFRPASDFAQRESEYQEMFLVIDEAVTLRFPTTRERMQIQNFLAKKSEEKAKTQRAKYASASTGNSAYHYKPREAALVIRTKSKSSDKKGGSTASSNGRASNSVTIRTPTRNAAHAAHVNSDTDEEDDPDFMDKADVEMDLFEGLS